MEPSQRVVENLTQLCRGVGRRRPPSLLCVMDTQCQPVENAVLHHRNVTDDFTLPSVKHNGSHAATRDGAFSWSYFRSKIQAWLFQYDSAWHACLNADISTNNT